jgi:hypothetical protein
VKFQLAGLQVRAIHTVLSFQSGEYADPRYPGYRVKHTGVDSVDSLDSLDVASLQVELSTASRLYESKIRGRHVATEIAWTFPPPAVTTAAAGNNNNNDDDRKGSDPEEADVIMRVTHHVSNKRSFVIAFSGTTFATHYRRQASTPRTNRKYKRGVHVNKLPSIDLDVELLLHNKWLTPAVTTSTDADADADADALRQARLQALSECVWHARFCPMSGASASGAAAAAAFAPAVHDMNSTRVYRFGDPLPLSFPSPNGHHATVAV